MDKLIISFNGPAEHIEQGDFFHSILWDALMPKIQEFANLRPYEKIDGLIITDTDIRVKISRKKGKTKKQL